MCSAVWPCLLTAGFDLGGRIAARQWHAVAHTLALTGATCAVDAQKPPECDDWSPSVIDCQLSPEYEVEARYAFSNSVQQVHTAHFSADAAGAAASAAGAAQPPAAPQAGPNGCTAPCWCFPQADFEIQHEPAGGPEEIISAHACPFIQVGPPARTAATAGCTVGAQRPAPILMLPGQPRASYWLPGL